MADLSIFRVTGIPPQEHSLFDELGVRQDADDLLRGAVFDIGKLCLQATRAYVPVSDRELRNSILLRQIQSLEFQVVIPELVRESKGGDTRRRTRKRGVRISNTLLAEILDGGVQRISPEIASPISEKQRLSGNHVFRQRSLVVESKPLSRTQDALGDGPFRGPGRKQPTANWIGEAQNALIEELDRAGQ